MAYNDTAGWRISPTGDHVWRSTLGPLRGASSQPAPATNSPGSHGRCVPGDLRDLRRKSPRGREDPMGLCARQFSHGPPSLTWLHTQPRRQADVRICTGAYPFSCPLGDTTASHARMPAGEFDGSPRQLFRPKSRPGGSLFQTGRDGQRTGHKSHVGGPRACSSDPTVDVREEGGLQAVLPTLRFSPRF